jgi:hypothetical protein
VKPGANKNAPTLRRVAAGQGEDAGSSGDSDARPVLHEGPSH